MACRREIDDGEPPVRKSDPLFGDKQLAAVVRAAMSLDGVHPCEEVSVKVS